MKSSSELGVALFKDREHFASCPIHSITVAAVMQSIPCAQLLGHLPVIPDRQHALVDDGATLLELIAS